MSGALLIAAVAIAVLAWHGRALTGRGRYHPDLLKSRGASVVVYGAGLAALGLAALAAVRFLGRFGLLLAVAAGAGLALSLATRRPGNARLADLRRSYDAFRRAYPSLDDEALFRFIVKERRPQWDAGRVQELTEDCSTLSELARRLGEDD